MPKILVVCTGNICRSPIAAQHLQQGLGDLGITVTSSGTFASEGQPVTAEANETYEQLTGLSTKPHQARQFHATQVIDAQLVITMTREQRTLVLQEVPSALSKVFTLREFSRFCATLTIEQIDFARQAGDLAARITAVTALVSMARGRTPPPESASDDDIVDPYMKSAQVYQTAISQIVAADHLVSRLIRSLAVA